MATPPQPPRRPDDRPGEAPPRSRDPLDRITRPPGSAPDSDATAADARRSGAPAATGGAPAAGGGSNAVLDRAAEQFTSVRRSLTVHEDDPWYVGGAKIFGMILLGALLLGLSPLIILGLIAGFAAAA